MFNHCLIRWPMETGKFDNKTHKMQEADSVEVNCIKTFHNAEI